MIFRDIISKKIFEQSGYIAPEQTDAIKWTLTRILLLCKNL